MAGGKCHLLDFREVVLWVSVQGESTEGPEWDIFLRPNLSQIEDVPTEILRLFRAEDLEIAGPAWIIAVLDRVEEVLCVPIWIFCSHVTCFGTGKCFAAEIRLAVNLDVVECAVRFRQLVGMT